MKRFYDSLKCVHGPPTPGRLLMLSADGATLITGKKEIVERWAIQRCSEPPVVH